MLHFRVVNKIDTSFGIIDYEIMVSDINQEGYREPNVESSFWLPLTEDEHHELFEMIQLYLNENFEQLDNRMFKLRTVELRSGFIKFYNPNIYNHVYHPALVVYGKEYVTKLLSLLHPLLEANSAHYKKFDTKVGHVDHQTGTIFDSRLHYVRERK